MGHDIENESGLCIDMGPFLARSRWVTRSKTRAGYALTWGHSELGHDGSRHRKRDWDVIDTDYLLLKVPGQCYQAVPDAGNIQN